MKAVFVETRVGFNEFQQVRCGSDHLSVCVSLHHERGVAKVFILNPSARLVGVLKDLLAELSVKFEKERRDANSVAAWPFLPPSNCIVNACINAINLTCVA